MHPLTAALVRALRDIEPFSRLILQRPLRQYQLAPARAAILSALHHDGEHYVWRFPRQSGKNETLAHVHLYLLFVFQRVKGATIVHTAPTFDPQAKLAMQRIRELAAGNPLFHNLRQSGNSLWLGQARILFLSGQRRDWPNVGATATLLLSKDECQDLDEEYVQQAFDPMTASTNAPHIHTGTARHDGTYLARKRRALEELERRDGKRRVFIIGWRDVAAELPAYGLHVQQVIARLGAQHPSVLTEYENIETARTGRLFDERRLALIYNTAQPRLSGPVDGAVDGAATPTDYVITIDVGGTSLIDDGNVRDGGRTDVGDGRRTVPDGRTVPDHDMTVATVHRVTTLSVPTPQSTNLREPAAFTTVDHFTLHGANVLADTPDRQRLFAYIDLWSPRRIVVDSTGLGIGLAGALAARYRGRVIPFQFTTRSKTDLLHEWLALIETGRYRHYSGDRLPDGRPDVDALRLREQLSRCEHEQQAGGIRWGVPAHGTWTDPLSGRDEPLHDDHLISTALVAALADDPALRGPREVTSTPAARRNSDLTGA